MLTRLIVIDIILFCSAIVVLFLGIRKYIYNAENALLKAGLGFYISFFEVLIAIGIKHNGDSRFTFILWVLTLFTVIVTVVLSSKAFKHTKAVVDYLNRYPQYKEIADNLFIGYATFGDSMPQKQYYKERKIYKKGINSFVKIQFACGELDIIFIQKKFRIMLISEMILISMGIAWILQFPVIVVMSWS